MQMFSIKAPRLLCLLLLPIFALPGQLTAQKPIDAKATKRTRALYQNLFEMKDGSTMFGHQDDLAYGVYWKGEPARSDVQETCGAYPAVFGWDLGRKFGENQHYNIDSIKFDDMRRMMRFAYKMGSVNTISWHLDNLTTGGDAWDTISSVRHILPGGKDHDKLLAQLDGLALFLKSLKTKGLFKHNIPVVFRPWHEHTGGWFWWGSTHCSPEEYKQLWRFTIDYLRNEKKVHHVLFAYSPDFFKDEAEYLRNYPGDDYVDILGLDYYYRAQNSERILADLPVKLALMAKMAATRRKVAAFTETGLESIPHDDWWTGTLLATLKTASIESNIAYVLVWRNAFKTKPNHYYAPFPGQMSAKNFVEFSRDSKMLFQNNLPDMYKKTKRK